MIAEVYEDCRGWLYSKALGLVKNPQDAEDLMQAVFVKAIRHLDVLRRPEAIGSWLKVVLANLAHDFHRKRKRQPAILSLDSEFDWTCEDSLAVEYEPGDLLEQAEPDEWIEDLLGSLPLHLEPVARDFYVDGLLIWQIAQHREMAEGTVKRKLHEARSLMRALVQQKGEYPQ